MQTRFFFQKMSDGTEIAVNRWMPDDETEIKGIIQLHHGLAEHSLRYDRLGCVLAENGYVFSAHDIRGHGRTAEKAKENGTGMFGKIADKNGWKRCVEDLNELVLKLKEDFPGKKTIFLGHSFGSLIGQAFIEQYASNIDLCILCGTSGPNPVALPGKIVADIICCLSGKNKTGKFLDKLAFGSYNNKIENPQSIYAWLSSNPDNVSLYESDSWCGIPLTNSFFADLTGLLANIHKKNRIKNIPDNLPILFIYGEGDPVGNYGKSIEKLIQIYIDKGIQDITCISYENDRHEIFNELDHDKVEADVLEWIGKKL